MTHHRITRRELITAGSGLLLFASQGCAKRSTYEEAVKDTWRHSAATLSDPAAILRELVRYATLAPNATTPSRGNFG